jgi:pyruvate carboxylase subunit A
MCAKLTVWALTWQDVVQRGKRALGDLVIYGVKTTIPYYLEILNNENFKDGEFNTSFVESHKELIDYDDELPPDVIAAAIAAAIAAHEGM